MAVRIDASQVEAVANLPNVRAVRRLDNYQLHLSETVPYIGAAAVQSLGFDGSGVRVAVLDSGVDYTHKNLGGPGTVEAYEAAYGAGPSDERNTTRDDLFPTAKVVDGYDFVGEVWPNPDPRCGLDADGKPKVCTVPDEDPIDFEGHGTHVSDIIAGRSADGAHKGVAPGASVLAVKVCSAVSTSCSGLALLQGMDFALDPNGDGDIDDAVDVINMSLGQPYGQREDDLSEASANAVRHGVVVVASAGNEADRPYIVGSPSSTPEVISVAQTQVPSAKLYLLETEGSGLPDIAAVHQPWSKAPELSKGPLAYDTSSAATARGCIDATGANPYAPGSHAGQILLMDRGVCAVSFKVSNARAAGALAAVVANNVSQAPGDLPPTFSFGGGDPSIPGYTVTLADGNQLKAKALGKTATIDPTRAVPLVGNMVSSSSRGPNYSFSAIKPDIGAPGASVSAEAGTGDGQTAFGGTSGAAPMVSGSAALLIQAHPDRTPAEIKAILMNTGETNIGLNPYNLPGVLAPITRVGGGEVRVDRALNSKTAAWDAEDITGSLSFGYHTITDNRTFNKRVLVRNYSTEWRFYTVSPRFRYADDAASGAVTVQAPYRVVVPPNGTASFAVILRVNASKLPSWELNGGSRGGDGYRLQGVEFDGHLNLSGGGDNIHLAWQILPHKAAAVNARPDQLNLRNGQGELTLRNRGATAGRVDVFSLTGTSPQVKKKELPRPGDNFAIIDLKAVGVRLVDLGGAPGIQFGITTYGERAHPNYPAEFDVYVDTNRDGTPDSLIFNGELGAFGSSGQNVVYVVNLTTGLGGPVAFSDADLNSANVILTVPLAAVGLKPDSQFSFSVLAGDNYFTGNITDAIENMTYTPGTPRFVATGVPTGGIPAGGSSTLAVQEVAGGATASPSQTGLLLLYRDAPLKQEAEIINVKS